MWYGLTGFVYVLKLLQYPNTSQAIPDVKAALDNYKTLRPNAKIFGEFLVVVWDSDKSHESKPNGLFIVIIT